MNNLLEKRLKTIMINGALILRAAIIYVGLLVFLRVVLVDVEGWTYGYSNTTMTWNESRNWCQTNYTDIVMIQNENVTRFLENYLPRRSGSYYWIGIKKSKGNWTWVANGQIAEYQSWAANEPNNILTNENCVEMYISDSKNNGKWNDEGCIRKKFPVCHKAQCLNSTCSDREDCIEQVNNYTCVCKTGFSGPRCETVTSCQKLSEPQYGQMKCSGPYGNHSLNSSCQFFCAGGYKLRGTAKLHCKSSGEWNAPPPTCAVECFPLLLFGVGLVNCTESHDTYYTTTCQVQCPPGHMLLGLAEITCKADDAWTSVLPIICASYMHVLIALLGCFFLSMLCCCLFCCFSCRSRTAIRSRTQQETVNPAYEGEHTSLDGPLCSA